MRTGEMVTRGLLGGFRFGEGIGEFVIESTDSSSKLQMLFDELGELFCESKGMGVEVLCLERMQEKNK